MRQTRFVHAGRRPLSDSNTNKRPKFKRASYPTWEDFVTKGAKLQSQLRTTIVVTGAFLDAFQKVADMATGTRGATKEIGSALTRMCMRHRSIESKLKLFTT
ncbi:Metastasis suppressor protein 1 [Liparis tanakae]|uniref:Metastasis suppressor protein 1 n=1 Tax=Liparis tanakae TaxID=230148 RepID=A0A4Z2FEV9_9TELE|nr:Metastasis suppressor protein 1 [Liparis tanakae]